MTTELTEQSYGETLAHALGDVLGGFVQEDNPLGHISGAWPCLCIDLDGRVALPRFHWGKKVHGGCTHLIVPERKEQPRCLND